MTPVVKTWCTVSSLIVSFPSFFFSYVLALRTLPLLLCGMRSCFCFFFRVHVRVFSSVTVGMFSAPLSHTHTKGTLSLLSSTLHNTAPRSRSVFRSQRRKKREYERSKISIRVKNQRRHFGVGPSFSPHPARADIHDAARSSAKTMERWAKAKQSLYEVNYCALTCLCVCVCVFHCGLWRSPFSLFAWRERLREERENVRSFQESGYHSRKNELLPGHR